MHVFGETFNIFACTNGFSQSNMYCPETGKKNIDGFSGDSLKLVTSGIKLVVRPELRSCKVRIANIKVSTT